jgi:hypothetical protein
MQDNERRCGTGTCITDVQGLCWCGQQWDGVKMCRPAIGSTAMLEAAEWVQTAQKAETE